MENMEENKNPNNQTTVIIQQTPSKSNGLGIAGFVLAILTLFLGWIPILGWILWILGAILSFCGIFKSPKGLAIAGLVISFINLIILICVIGAIGALASL